MGKTTSERFNEIIAGENPRVLQMLSTKGKKIFFPTNGILAQGAEAKNAELNATIGIALKDDNSPEYLKSVSKNLKLGSKDAFPYAPGYGKNSLRLKWKKMIYEKNPSLTSEISLPIVTSGLTHGISICEYLFANDEIIIPSPYWGNYNLIFEYGFNDTKIIKIPLFDKYLNIHGIEKELNKPGDKKLLILNFPNNPTGYTPTFHEVEEMQEMLKSAADNGKKIVVICDDAYFGLVYENNIFKESIFALLANLHENILAVKIDGATKEDFAWGFRVGFVTYGIKNGTKKLYEALENKTAGVIRRMISNCSHPAQTLLLKAFNDKNYLKEKDEKFLILQARYNEVRRVIKEFDHRHFEPLPYNSGYFMCVRIKNLEADAVRQHLLRKYSTGTIAIENNIRIAFSAVPLNQIQTLFENLYATCEELSKC